MKSHHSLTTIADFFESISDLQFIFYLATAVLLVVNTYLEQFEPGRAAKTKKRSKVRRPKMNMDQQQDIKLGGLNMNFPYIPYGIQKAMLSKIAVTLTNKEHSLIESPTGTGKTLVLLCASLAWQQESKANQTPVLSARYKKRLAEIRLEYLRNRPCSCGRRPNRTELDELKEAKGEKKGVKVDGYADDIDDLKQSAWKKMKLIGDDNGTSPYFKNSTGDNKSNSVQNKQSEVIFIDLDDDEFDYKKPKQENLDTDLIEIIDETNESKKLTTNDRETKNSQDMCKNCKAIEVEDAYMEEMGEPGAKVLQSTKIPKIYYGTRTHKQITQVVRELKKTKYCHNLRMSILSSRDRTCINEDVKDLPDRNDKCQELIKNKPKNSNSRKAPAVDTCPYYRESNNMAVEFEQIYEEYKNEAWDIEDALSFAKSHYVCPYYGARAIQENADITFCPYNYLLDPNIRKALNINLTNSVIILDEAHNIEDICRDSASFTIDTTHIDEILTSIVRAAQMYMQGSAIRDAYDYFRNILTDIKIFLMKYEFNDRESQRDGDCLARHIMAHQEMMDTLEGMNLGARRLQTLKESLKALRGEDDESGSDRPKGDDGKDAALNNNEMHFVTQLTNTLDFMYGRQGKYCADYKMIVSKHLERQKPSQIHRHQNKAVHDVHMFQLSLLCMNPGVAFEKIHSSAWSVIVASGTLAPIDSLKTELGCDFAQVFEGSHVISDDRIFASILSQGPNRIDLNCAYSNSLTMQFQDEVGLIVRDVCQTVPNGVLCFFPSYDRMENLYQRWFAKGYMRDIEKGGKKLFREQKSFSPSKFEEELNKYHKLAKTKGALLFAVFRGKVSEGIDFSDTAARAVITIGIPYPNVKELTVNLKREYNDVARRTKPHLMPGSDWYASQAFRALNQALGRCIRHKADWGAILMIDSRLKNPSSLNNISKWIRRVVNTTPDYSGISRSLKEFVERRVSDNLDD